MIHDHDRSGWIGASDTARVMGKWSGKTFDAWWREKLGLSRNTVSTKAMKAGNEYEGKVLDYLGITQRDRQIRDRDLRLRVNLDGEKDGLIYEVKTHKKPTFIVTKPYWMQCQVEQYITGERCQIVAYRLLPEDYDNFFNAIDGRRLTFHAIPYDRGWVINDYLPRLKELSRHLKKGGWPDERAWH